MCDPQPSPPYWETCSPTSADSLRSCRSISISDLRRSIRRLATDWLRVWQNEDFGRLLSRPTPTFEPPSGLPVYPFPWSSPHEPVRTPSAVPPSTRLDRNSHLPHNIKSAEPCDKDLQSHNLNSDGHAVRSEPALSGHLTIGPKVSLRAVSRATTPHLQHGPRSILVVAMRHVPAQARPSRPSSTCASAQRTMNLQSHKSVDAWASPRLCLCTAHCKSPNRPDHLRDLSGLESSLPPLPDGSHLILDGGLRLNFRFVRS